MKPRIKQGWDYVFMGTMIPLHGWFCEGGGVVGFSISPRAAYFRWQSLIYQRETDAMLKPEVPLTGWQQFKKDLRDIWNADIFARIA